MQKSGSIFLVFSNKCSEDINLSIHTDNNIPNDVNV
jgi:hypothetical protein